jgi:predicted CoA-binding protein
LSEKVITKQGKRMMTKAPLASNAAVLGASPKEDRYSFKAVRMLKEHGFKPIPVHPAGHSVDGIAGLKSLDEITEPVDTLTVYVSAGVSSAEMDKILKLKPRRVIFNPGAENHDLAEALRKTGIEVVEACTLVMLRTEQY